MRALVVRRHEDETDTTGVDIVLDITGGTSGGFELTGKTTGVDPNETANLLGRHRLAGA